jgi:hypothetical protein
MRKIIPFLLMFSFLTMVMAQPSWDVFQSFDGKFKILTPGEMVKKENPIKTEIGELNYITYLHQPTRKNPDNLVYMVSYCDYPKYSIHSDSTELVKEFFKTTVETAVESVEGELSYSSDITMNEFPGRLWRVDYNDGKALIKTKSFLVKNRYYSIQVISLKDKGMNLQIDEFLDSFSLLSSDENANR